MLSTTLASNPATKVDTPPRPPTRLQAAPKNHDVPPWVVAQTGVTSSRLGLWAVKGWLTPPGHNGTRPGKGHRFDWQAALEQIDWLRRLHHDRRLDREDADAGWRLRAAGCEWAVRHHPGPWIPVDTLMAVKPLAVAGTVITVAKVRTP